MDYIDFLFLNVKYVTHLWQELWKYQNHFSIILNCCVTLKRQTDYHSHEGKLIHLTQSQTNSWNTKSWLSNQINTGLTLLTKQNPDDSKSSLHQFASGIKMFSLKNCHANCIWFWTICWKSFNPKPFNANRQRFGISIIIMDQLSKNKSVSPHSTQIDFKSHSIWLFSLFLFSFNSLLRSHSFIAIININDLCQWLIMFRRL